MPAKKKESLIDKAEEKIKDVAEKIIEEVKNITEKVGDEIEEVFTDKSKAPKKKLEKKGSEDKKSKMSALLEKAKKLEGKISKDEEVDLKSKVKLSEDQKADTLVPIEDYLKSSIHLGTRVITPDMKKFVYKRRADGLAVFNTNLIDDKLREFADRLAEYAPEDIILACKRESGWAAVEKFAEITGIKIFTKKYPAGILTNPNLENFIETELMFVCDPWIDKNAVEDAKKIRVPIFSICDTNNYTQNVNHFLVGNNKSAKSFGMIFYLLAKLYTEKRKMKVKVPEIKEWIENWDSLTPPK